MITREDLHESIAQLTANEEEIRKERDADWLAALEKMSQHVEISIKGTMPNTYHRGRFAGARETIHELKSKMAR